MESVINCLRAKAELIKAKIDIDLAHEVTSHFISQSPNISLEDIIKLICRYYRLDRDSLRSKSRKRLYSNARNIYVYLARKHTDKPLTEIARAINRTHSTAIYAFEKIKKELKGNSEIKKQVLFLDSKVSEVRA